jgi:hypothetical protein
MNHRTDFMSQVQIFFIDTLCVGKIAHEVSA